MHFVLTGGQVHDATAAIPLLKEISIFGSYMLGNSAYGSLEIRQHITSCGAIYTTQPKENFAEPWFCDYYTYKERRMVECFINKMKAFPRVATRYDKLAASFIAFVHLTAILLLAKWRKECVFSDTL